MTGRPEPTPEGALIHRAMTRKGVSAPAVAEAAGLSATRWRHIVNGAQPLGGGRYNQVVAPPATLARMALAVDVTPEQLEEVGRSDAAEVLRDLLSHPDRESGSYRDPQTGETYVDQDERAIWDRVNLPEDTRRELIYYLRTKLQVQASQQRRAS